MRNREEIKNRKEYAMLQTVAKYMDKYHLDGMIGFVPYVGDYFFAVALIPFVYVTLFIVKSVPLTLAVINNHCQWQNATDRKTRGGIGVWC